MKKSITPRELLLLGFLIIITVYYFVIQGPIKKQTDELTVQKSQLESQIQSTLPVIEEKKMWEEAIKEVFDKDPNPSSILDYDNINAIILEMNAIFDTGNNSYTIAYSTGNEVTFEDNIVSRQIRISFNSPSYDDAYGRIKQLHDSKNKYQITNLYISKASDGYQVSITLIDYEFANYY